MAPPLHAIPADGWTCPDCAQASKGRDQTESARSEVTKKKKKARSLARSPTPPGSTQARTSATGACVGEEEEDDDDDAPLLFLHAPQKDQSGEELVSRERKKRRKAEPSPSSLGIEGNKYFWNGHQFVKRPKTKPKVGGWGNLADSDEEDACPSVQAAGKERERERQEAQERGRARMTPTNAAFVGLARMTTTEAAALFRPSRLRRPSDSSFDSEKLSDEDPVDELQAQILTRPL